MSGEYAYVNIQGPPGPDGYLLPGRVVKVDLVLRRVVGQFPAGRANFDLAEANGKLYLANASDDNVTVIDPVHNWTKTIGGVGDFPSAVTASPDGSRVFVADFESRYLHVIDTSIDQVVLNFLTGRGGAVKVGAYGDEVFVRGAGGGTLFGVVAFRREGFGYVREWDAILDFSNGLAFLDRELFSVSRRQALEIVPLDEPHDNTRLLLGNQHLADLHGIEAHDGALYIVGEEGLFRFSTAERTAELLYQRELRSIDIAPCPRGTATFAGDADCDETLTALDVEATIRAGYDPTAQERCDADCNGDGRVGAADLVCAVRVLATS